LDNYSADTSSGDATPISPTLARIAFSVTSAVPRPGFLQLKMTVHHGYNCKYAI